ncbi:MAG: rRNA adenine dimethyltransferase family protein, partial [Candidatus Dojkabacteria bacterium]|nr:rRNA adenine dimethyltransferase family protein [Candidatus Dojkabacteria bacterium]
RGFFTEKLIKGGKNVLAIEKDDNFAKELILKNISVLNIDFQEWNFKEIEGKDVIFFGSLPYNVSKRIISKIIESKYFKNNAYFIIQKEVAEKYINKEPNNNLLSIKTSLYANVKKVLDIGPNSFKPAPKVNSCLTVFLQNKQSDIKEMASFQHFLEIAFTHPRKTLKNNLKKYRFKKKVGTLLDKRPQHLSTQQYIELFNGII